jgi:riboflavin kinase / FMN adenylyltransferase
VFTRVADFSELPPIAGPVHLAVGVFDGVHLGHREVLGLAVRNAKASAGVAGVLTFDPHPSRLFRPENPTLLLVDPKQKDELLAGVGLDFVVHHRFDLEFAALPAEEFLPWLRERLPNLSSLYIGENFRFGRKRAGDAALLVAQGKALGVHVFAANRIAADGERISSTRIRGLVAAGRVDEAAGLLGYEYFGEGGVIPGRRLGRTLGFPTLNVSWDPELRPAYGVYAVHLRGPDGVWREGVANYGVRPTVEHSPVTPQLEVHLFAPASEVAAAGLGEGAFVRVSLRRFIRPEMKFSGLDALKKQIAADVAAAK